MSLYDPNEFPETKTVSPDFTLEDVLAWARTKPADEEYCYTSNGNCAIAQFLLETGRSLDPNVGGCHPPRGPLWADRDKKWHEAPVDVGIAAGDHPRTFGAFADRLEKALS